MSSLLGILSLFNNWTSIVLVTLVTLYFYSTRNYNYWKSRGVTGPKPLPFIGNLGQLFSKARGLQMIDELKKFGTIYGIYEGSNPVLMISEPELIRDITVKDFDKFIDRRLPPSGSPLFDESLLTARGDKWKQMRVTVSPTFSTAKMRKMFRLIEECVGRLDNYLSEVSKSSDNEIVLKKIFTNYTMDVIAMCAFATKIDTYKQEIHPFIENAQKLFTPTPRFGLFFLLTNICPSFVKKYNFSFVSSKVWNYFESILESIIRERESEKESNFVDFLQLLLNEKKKSDNEDIDEDIKEEIERINQFLSNKRKYKLRDIDIMATSTFFLLAGSETTSAAISHLLHELALNPECQQKLFEEIKSYEDLNYDTISQMPYLDACVNETLRKYPAVVFNQRTANEDYELGDTGLQIEKNMSVRIATYALHHNPEYFPNPEQFNPDRFIPSNKSKLIPYSFVPFGTGPRNCVGMRFALMNMKTVVANILAKYRFCQTSNTLTKFEYKKFVVFPQPLDMGTLRLELRV